MVLARVLGPTLWLQPEQTHRGKAACLLVMGLEDCDDGDQPVPPEMGLGNSELRLVFVE